MADGEPLFWPPLVRGIGGASSMHGKGGDFMTPVDVEIAIIGAGAAGIAAARTAMASGLSFRLIEARPRLGGRTWTDATAGGLPFDRGASWIHAVDQGNPFAELALAARAAPVLDRRRRIMLDGSGGRAANAAIDGFHASRAAAIRLIEGAAAGASLAAALAGHHAPPDDLWVMTDRALAGPWLMGEDCALVDAADWLAAKAGADWLLPAGYGRLVEELGQGLPVTLDCPLEALAIGRDHVGLETARGRFTARHAILTVPLGVLQAGRIRFDPPLPAAARRAIDDLPMGCLMKVAIDLLADPLGESGTYYLHYPAPDESGVLYLLRPGGHEMALAFVGGGTARALERESDAVAREAVLAPLVRLLGAATVERSFGAARATRWGLDPLALGSYAIARPGIAPDTRARLAAPIFERLYLAGEGTAPDGWHNTVAGAWLAGKAAVLRITAGLSGAAI